MKRVATAWYQQIFSLTPGIKAGFVYGLVWAAAKSL